MSVRRAATAVLVAAGLSAALVATTTHAPASNQAKREYVCAGLHGSSGWDAYCASVDVPTLPL